MVAVEMTCRGPCKGRALCQVRTEKGQVEVDLGDSTCQTAENEPEIPVADPSEQPEGETPQEDGTPVVAICLFEQEAGHKSFCSQWPGASVLSGWL